MTRRPNIVVAGRNLAAVDRYSDCLSRSSRFEVQKSHMTNGTCDPLHSSESSPSLLIVHVDAKVSLELEELSKRSADQRPPVIVIAAEENPELMRLAMRAGCRDFFVEPISESDLLGSTARLLAETTATHSGSSTVTALVNSTGGSGSSFLAVNLAHALQSACGCRTGLVDLDIQFAPLSQYLDVQGKLGVIDAIMHADDLDEVAFRAYLTPHESGVALLGGVRGKELVQVDSTSSMLVESWQHILGLMSSTFDQVVIDVPRHLDALGMATLRRADTVLLVLQQSLLSVREAAYLRQLLRTELGIPAEAIRCVVNRHEKRAAVEIADVKRALRTDDLLLLPNDYAAAAQSVDVGKPLLEHVPRSPLARATRELALAMTGAHVERKGLFSKMFGG